MDCSVNSNDSNSFDNIEGQNYYWQNHDNYI